VSFKNTRETAQAINGWKLQRAQTFLENVCEKKEAVPMRRYCGSIGRTAQGTTYNANPSLSSPDMEFEIWEMGKLGKRNWTTLGMIWDWMWH
jgi:ribosomal protein L22